MRVLVVTLALWGCKKDETGAPPVTTESLAFEQLAADLPGALLSVQGAGGDDLWVVGAMNETLQGTVLQADGQGGWTRHLTGAAYDLWWVQSFGPDSAFVGGAGATVMEWDGSTWTRHRTPGLANQTIYGVWGSSASDLYAVGGFAGRYGFIWHYDGSSWSDVGLPDEIPLDGAGELPSLFKVWGSGPDDVWVVGDNGTVLRFDGSAWTVVPSPTDELLFTVAGRGDQVLIVGAEGAVLDEDLEQVGPVGAPLLQGVTVDPDGVAWIAGQDGATFRGVRSADGTYAWDSVSLGLGGLPQSFHGVHADDGGQLWLVGGTVLESALDAGVLVHGGELGGMETVLPADVDTTVDESCPSDRIDIEPDGSMARRWNELQLDMIRRAIPHPPFHARNLYHVSVAMYDAWAAFEPDATGFVYTVKHTADDKEAAQDAAISHAAAAVLRERFTGQNGEAIDMNCIDDFMSVLGLDAAYEGTTGDDPASVGNLIGAEVLARFLGDGANEANAYADTTGYTPVNEPLLVDQYGTPLTDPNHWQELNLAVAETQNGLIVESGVQGYIGPNWGYVEPFALPDADERGVRLDVDLVPSVDDPEMKGWVVEVIRDTAWLDADDGEMIDISPGAFGNNSLGTNDGAGHPLNPVTGEAYPPNLVPRGDFTRVLAEFWADGPSSETPPGHWNTLANAASDAFSPDDLRPFGEGEAVDRLEWDVKMYLTMNGGLHDAAVTAWGLKRAYTSTRPISLVRWMAQNGQSSDPSAPSYHEDGLPLEDGLIELITEESSAPGERHHHLRWWIGEVAVFTWLGEPGERTSEVGAHGWMRGGEWIPYQRRTFVTPAFPGLVSGHSTFSRSAAEALTRYTGSPYFPGGIGEFVASEGAYLVFEDGPSVDVRLQWASYYDAADQAGQSRLWGGIHIWPDDGQGRVLGHEIGTLAADKAEALFAP
jgi:hypothetical protein